MDFPIPRAVIFDVDGTLYDQQKLRLRMVWEMIRSVMIAQRRIKDMKILWNFRKMRESWSPINVTDIERQQYLYGSKVLKVSPSVLQNIVQEWIYQRPLKHLSTCRFAEIEMVFTLLRQRAIPIGIFSDYPAHEKLKALRLEADVVVSATDKEVGRFKPDPLGLWVLAERLGIPVHDCLLVGDRDDRDGECARNAGMPYVILTRKHTFGHKIQSVAQLKVWIEEWPK
jgi:HAD superfamily hydrolase (TIGR01549 family)